METNKETVNTGKEGLNRDLHPHLLQSKEYTFALNANYEDENGNSFNLQNEHSNLLCTSFKEGFSVVGFVQDTNAERVYFFLANETTQVSEIGYIDNIRAIGTDNSSDIDCGTCNFEVEINTPLENTSLTSICTYTTILTDDCLATKCLNFKVTNPITGSNVFIKDEKCGKTIYFTDGLNPQRHINLDDLDLYKTRKEGCTDLEEDICLDCDNMRIFPKYKNPCIKPQTIVLGGSLTEGTYEFLVAYSDSTGNEMSEYLSITNPVDIFDTEDIVRDQSTIGKVTNLAIGLEIEGLDTSFGYYKIVSMERNSLTSDVSYREVGVFPITNKKVIYSSNKDKSDITLAELLTPRVKYKTAKGMATSNGHLFQYGLKAVETYNLQPIVNLLGGFLRWKTYQAKEDLYADGVQTSMFKSYLRDETYPFSIRFYDTEGTETALFPFIARPSIGNEKDIIKTTGGSFVDEQTDVNSLEDLVGTCYQNDRQYRWQYYNTAQTLPNECLDTGGNSFETVIREVEKSCVVLDGNGDVEVINEILNTTVTIPLGLEVTSLLDFINSNQSYIENSTDSFWTNYITLTNTYSGISCSPNYDSFCSTAVLESTEGFPIDVEGEVIELIKKPIGSYEKAEYNTDCLLYETDNNGDKILDTEFINKYTDVNIAEDIYKIKEIETNNKSCNTSTSLGIYDPSVTNYTSYHLERESSSLSDTNNCTVSEESLLDTSSFVPTVGTGASLPNTSYSFSTNSLHSNVIWFSTNIVDGDLQIIEIPPQEECIDNTSNNLNIIRLSFFRSCTDNNAVSSVLVDITNGSFIELNTSDFPNGQILIAVDSAIREQDIVTSISTPNTECVYTLTTPCSCFTVINRPVEYLHTQVTFDRLTIGERQNYTSQCEYNIPEYNSCNPIPVETGLFSYIESEVNYPCNKELYDSSELIITPTDVETNYRSEFEQYYTDGGVVVNGNYVLNSETDFRDKPIRHYKFPSSELVPFMSDSSIAPGDFNDSFIYPIGVYIDNTIINNFLDIAVKNGLLSIEQRNKIYKYEIFRGDRRVDKSIVAKGLLYDLKKYKEKGEDVYYPNYPYNNLGSDKLHGIGPINSGQSNDKFTFHSPDIHYYKPSLPTEVKLEGYQFGKSEGSFDEVEGHSKWVILGDKAVRLARTLGIAEAALELVTYSGERLTQAAAGGLSAPAAAVVAAATIASYTISSVFKASSYVYQWLETFKNLGTPYNFAYYYSSVGHYNYFRKNTNEQGDFHIGNSIRGIKNSSYLREGNWSVNKQDVQGTVRINNLDRESSLYIELRSNLLNPSYYRDYDNSISNPKNTSLFINSDIGCSEGRSSREVRNISSPYVSLKNYVPSQYGDIDSIKWLNTSYCGILNDNNSCDAVFGGDTFISRFSLKRKMNLFLDNAFDIAPLTPFPYKIYRNIPSLKYWVNYEIDDSSFSFGNSLFPNRLSEYRLDCLATNNTFYIKPRGSINAAKFYLFYYGIPYFLVESGINNNYRYAGRESREGFYPYNNDYLGWTQEKNVPIRARNRYNYPFTYSQGQSLSRYSVQQSNFELEKERCKNDLPNGIIYSKKDTSENDDVDPWLVYKPLDFKEFETSNGDLVDVRGIESNQLIARFENTTLLYNKLNLYTDGLNATNVSLTTGSLFGERPLEYHNSTIGYAGTQHKAMVSNEFGHFWVDSKRGQVFQINPNGQGLKEITGRVRHWLKEHLPFKIVNYNITGLSYKDTDNSYNGLGIDMGWDSLYKRVFITKRDYIVTYNGNDELEYEGGKFYLRDTSNVRTEIELSDTEYFEDISWTLAYSPYTESWVSYYSFTPDYYITQQDFFQTGVNNNGKDEEKGLWSHLLTNDSYQVFYGKKYPFTVEIPVTNKGYNSKIKDVEYWLDTRKYINRYDFSEKRNVGFNKAIVYNNSQNTGLLKLVPQEVNNLQQQIKYPKYNTKYIEVLTSQYNKKWSFNYLYNMVKNEYNNAPIWINSRNQINKELNHRAISYTNKWKDRLEGDWFLTRLTNDQETRYKMIFKWLKDERTFNSK